MLKILFFALEGCWWLWDVFFECFLRFLIVFKVWGRFRGLAGCPRGWAPPRSIKKKSFSFLILGTGYFVSFRFGLKATPEGYPFHEKERNRPERLKIPQES